MTTAGEPGAGRPRIALVLSGVAPAMTLMSGAMLEFAKADIRFDAISTSGVGALVGMLYLAPEGGRSPEEALASLPNLFVSDAFHCFFPVNVKIFHKKGPFSEPIWRMGRKLPRFHLDPRDPGPGKRLYNDLLDFWITAFTPSTLTRKSKGLMTPLPLVDELVDFEALKASQTQFYLNAFNAGTKRLKIFTQDELDADTYAAGQAMSFLYPLSHFGKDVYSIGSTHDPTGLQTLWMDPEPANRPDAIVCLDSMSYSYWREPTNIFDAFQLMLLNPIVALQRNMYALYAATETLYNRKLDELRAQGKAGDLQPMPRLYRISMRKAVEDLCPTAMLSWSHSSAVALEDAGKAAAAPFVERLVRFIEGDADALDRYRFRKHRHFNHEHGCWMHGESEERAHPQGFVGAFERSIEDALGS